MNNSRFLARRRFLRLACFTGVTAATGRVWAQSSKAVSPGRTISLRDMLNTGLKSRRPEEFAFIETVVDLVEAGVLPESLVRSTFAYARRKRPYPFVYFRSALRTRAKKKGINV